MKKILRNLSVFVMILVFLFPSILSAQERGIELGKGWSFEESVTIPVMKLTDGEDPGIEAQAELYTGLGGGVCFSYQKQYADGTKHRIFTVSPFTVLLSGEEGEDEVTKLNVAYAMTVGFFNDKIMLGVGRDFGKVSGRSRWFGMLSLGVTFN